MAPADRRLPEGIVEALDDAAGVGTDERADLERTAARLVAGHADGGLEAPPPELWAGIAAATGAGSGPAPRAAPIAPPRRRRPARRRAPPPSHPPGGAPPARPRRVRAPALVALAAAIVVLLAAAALLATRDDDDVVERAVLVALPGAEGRGEARLVAGDGRWLDVDLDGVTAPPGEYLEVWLLAEDLSRLTSLGPVRPDGRYLVPPDLDVAASPVVDISAERPDGDPTHSGASIVRGRLA